MRSVILLFPRLRAAAGARALQFLLILATCLTAPCRSLAGNAESAFEAANKLYEEGRFSEAANAYEGILLSEGVSSGLYFNLGNAHFKSGQLGRAIAAYQNARRLDPRDPDITANLQFARNQRQGHSMSASTFQRWLGRFSLNEWAMLTTLAFWAWLLLMALLQLRPTLKKALRGTLFVLGASTVGLGILLIAVWRADRLDTVVVVINPEASVRHGPLDESQASFTVHDGAELRLLDKKGDWYQVTAGPNRVGWIKQESVILD